MQIVISTHMDLKWKVESLTVSKLITVIVVKLGVCLGENHVVFLMGNGISGGARTFY